MARRTQLQWEAGPFQMKVLYKVNGIMDRHNILDWFADQDEVEFIGAATAVTNFKNHSKNYVVTLVPQTKVRSVGTTVQKEEIGGIIKMVTTQWTIESDYNSETGESVLISAAIIGLGNASPDGDVITIPP